MKHFYRICLVYPGIQDMDAIGNIHEVRFLNIYTLSSIISYILPLTIIIVLAIKVVGFSNFRQSLRHLQCIMIISKITHELFWSNIFYFKLKSLLDHCLRVEKNNTKTMNWLHFLNMLKILKYFPT